MGHHTATHCHCGEDRQGSDHCPECGCEEFESVCDYVAVKTPTGHVIGAVYRSAYWGGHYRVIGPAGPYGVEVECVIPGGGAHQVPGERWTHMTTISSKDERIWQS
jgi:hypothetical protein